MDLIITFFAVAVLGAVLFYVRKKRKALEENLNRRLSGVVATILKQRVVFYQGLSERG